MTDMIIVAIPDANDSTWQFSSEKVPHVTLLYLNNDTHAQEIVEFVEHATETMLERFDLSVSSRGELGDDKADVVFFEKWGMDRLTRFRNALLQNTHIKAAYDDKFPVWTPHLTLGYPDNPAKPTVGDRVGPTWIQFDRIAVWTSEYDGPEFKLSDHDYTEDMAMADKVEKFLSHHGVKGMRWGVRRKTSANGTVTVTGKATAGKAKIKTSGGEGAKPHADAIAARVGSQKLKKGGVNSLSNKELQDLALRLNLERQVNNLTPKPPAKRFVAKLLGDTAKSQATRVANDTATKQVGALLDKRK